MSAILHHFALCDHMISDKATNKESIIGMFDRLTAMVYPTVLPDCQLVLGVVGVEKGSKVKVQLISPQNQVILEITGKAEAEARYNVTTIKSDLRNVIIPSVGIYWFEVTIDTQSPIRFPFHVEYAVPEPIPMTAAELEKALANPNAAKSARLVVACGKCKKEHSFQRNLDPNIPIPDDMLPFPEDGIVECSCGGKIDATAIFRHALSELGKEHPAEFEAAAAKDKN
jgi:hypothetical protein